jgi:hypothetical protein
MIRATHAPGGLPWLTKAAHAIGVLSIERHAFQSGPLPAEALLVGQGKTTSVWPPTRDLRMEVVRLMRSAGLSFARQARSRRRSQHQE